MWIGVGRIVLDFFGNLNVSKKRKNVEDLCVDLRKRYNVSCLEVASFDDPERCVIGFSAVIPENWKTVSAEDFVKKICETIDTEAFARVVVEDWDLLSHGTEKEHDDAYEREAARNSPEAKLIAKKLENRQRDKKGRK
ncbi:MAG: DUF503 family protein [Bdellovibrionales bacterium]|nr:DUF503 family protein [Bdellovibrionales bacterium]